MPQSTGATPSNTSAPTASVSSALAAAQSALTAAGEQYAASNDAPYEDRQDLAEHIRELRASVEQLKDGAR